MAIRSDIKEDRRSWKRFTVLMKANYLLQNNQRYKECTLIDVSRQGACIKTPIEKDISIAASIFLEIFTKEVSTINISGNIKWIKETENGLIIGLKFKTLLDNNVFKNL